MASPLSIINRWNQWGLLNVKIDTIPFQMDQCYCYWQNEEYHGSASFVLAKNTCEQHWLSSLSCNLTDARSSAYVICSSWIYSLKCLWFTPAESLTHSCVSHCSLFKQWFKGKNMQVLWYKKCFCINATFDISLLHSF